MRWSMTAVISMLQASVTIAEEATVAKLELFQSRLCKEGHIHLEMEFAQGERSIELAVLIDMSEAPERDMEESEMMEFTYKNAARITHMLRSEAQPQGQPDHEPASESFDVIMRELKK